MVAPLRQLFEAACKGLGKRFEQTKQGFEWLARISVQKDLNSYPPVNGFSVSKISLKSLATEHIYVRK